VPSATRPTFHKTLPHRLRAILDDTGNIERTTISTIVTTVCCLHRRREGIVHGLSSIQRKRLACWQWYCLLRRQQTIHLGLTSCKTRIDLRCKICRSALAHKRVIYLFVAERIGFEPTRGFPLLLFQNSAIGHSATSPINWPTGLDSNQHPAPSEGAALPLSFR
jgi:hypothetical protein